MKPILRNWIWILCCLLVIVACGSLVLLTTSPGELGHMLAQVKRIDNTMVAESIAVESPTASEKLAQEQPFMQGQNEVEFSADFVWPHWAKTARIVGAYFHPTNSDREIDAQLDALAAQNVSVIIADSPLGEQYAVWADDAEFAKVRALIAKVVKKAHARGLKIVLYHVGLELISPGSRNPWQEHPQWAQLGLDGKPILYNDVSNDEEHWLSTGIWDYWLTPCLPQDNVDQAFRTTAFARISEMVTTGIDGLWVDQVYLQSSVGSHHDLWPSTDPCSQAAFTAATGLSIPKTLDWDDEAFQRWVVWRHTQIVDFLTAEKQVARSLNPNLVFFNENSSVDGGRSTYVGNDPTAYRTIPDMSTGHEIETMADRMDLGETGMQSASLDHWLDFRTMVAYARAADRGKPSWILTYGYQPRDSAQLAGVVVAEGANFYETKGPQMADTVDSTFRTRLFSWIAAHEGALYEGESLAEVGLLYSPRTRDLVDTVSGAPYDLQDSVHFAAYRKLTRLLYRKHIPLHIVIDTDTAAFDRYKVLIVPEVQAMSDETLTALQAFTGTLITVGESGNYDEWLQPRSSNLLTSTNHVHFKTVNQKIGTLANSGLVQTNAPASLQFGLRQLSDGYALTLVNTAAKSASKAWVKLRLLPNEVVSEVSFSDLDQWQQAVSFSQIDGYLQVILPTGMDTLGLVTVKLSSE